MRLFTLDHRDELSLAIADRLGVELSPVEIRRFEDGEYKIRPLVSVNGEDVYVIATFAGDPAQPVHDKLCLTMFFTAALKDALARSVSLVAPYLAYTRKDQRTKLRDPLSVRYLATLLESVGVSLVACMDAHNVAAFESAFRIPTEHLSARDVLVARLAERLQAESVTLMSPDFGGAKRVHEMRAQFDKLRGSVDTKFGLVIKERSAGVLKGGEVLGEVGGRTVVILDDLISTGETALKAARACRELGAKRVLLAATHAPLSPHSLSNLAESAIDAIIVSNTLISQQQVPKLLAGKLEIVDVSRVFASAIELRNGQEPRGHRSDLA